MGKIFGSDSMVTSSNVTELKKWSENSAGGRGAMKVERPEDIAMLWCCNGRSIPSTINKGAQTYLKTGVACHFGFAQTKMYIINFRTARPLNAREMRACINCNGFEYDLQVSILTASFDRESLYSLSLQVRYTAIQSDLSCLLDYERCIVESCAEAELYTHHIPGL